MIVGPASARLMKSVAGPVRPQPGELVGDDGGRGGRQPEAAVLDRPARRGQAGLAQLGVPGAGGGLVGENTVKRRLVAVEGGLLPQRGQVLFQPAAHPGGQCVQVCDVESGEVDRHLRSPSR